MDELDLKIFQELEQDNMKKTVFLEDSISITRGAFEKAKLYAKLSSQIAGTGMECYGYLLMKQDSFDNVITDVYFADEQLVQNAYVQITEEAVQAASRSAAASGHKIVGWWHSHGNLSPFHSGTDERNFRSMLQYVAPDTMYINKEVLFVSDDDKKEILIDNIRIKNVDAKSFKDSKPEIVKKEEVDPYAFSMVLNMRGEYYLERISKTFNSKTKQYDRNHPIRPKLNVVDADNDLEFLVSTIEKDIHKKLIFPASTGYGSGFSYASPDWETSPKNRRISSSYTESPEVSKAKNYANQYRKLIEEFVEAARDYIAAGDSGLNLKAISEFLLSDGNKYRYDILKDIPEAKLSADELRSARESVGKKKNEAVSNIAAALSDTDARRYTNDDKKLDINEMRNLVSIQFMIDVIHKHRKYSGRSAGQDERQKYITKIDGAVNDFRRRAVTLAESFATAVNATKAMTYYSMENLTDYKQQKNHKYKNVIRRILDNLASDRNFSIAESVNIELKYGSKNNKATEFFLYPERFNIVNQMTRDLYNYKLSLPEEGKENGSKLAIIKQRHMVSFIEKFSDMYMQEEKGENKVDPHIEEHLLSPNFNGMVKFFEFYDKKKAVKDYNAEDKSLAKNQNSRWSRWMDETTDDSVEGNVESAGTKIDDIAADIEKDILDDTEPIIADDDKKIIESQHKGIFYWITKPFTKH